MLSLSDDQLAEKLVKYKESLKEKIVRANAELAEVKFKYKTN
jgi:5-(carboxyamino)imidazole ribonucleotide mutase